MLLGSWNAVYGYLRGPSDQLIIVNGSINDIRMPPGTTLNSGHNHEGTIQNSAAQQVFGDHVRASRLWPISSSWRPRFSYVLYATRKKYLCSAVSIPMEKFCVSTADVLQ